MKASSESGECASLISTVSFSVFEAVCWPDMGLSDSFSSATPARPGRFKRNLEGVASPGFGSSQRDIPAEERVYRRRTGENVRVAGACVAPRPAISCKSNPNISAPGEQLEEGRALGTKSRGTEREAGSRTLQRRDHARDGVIECGAAIKVRLPEFLQSLEVLVPAALIEAFAQSVGSVAAAGDAAIVIASSGARRAKHRADDFAGGVENQGVPEVARDGFVALVALPDDGGLYGLGDAVRTFVEKNFERRRAL